MSSIWEGVLDIGYHMDGDAWSVRNTQVYNDYSAKRKLFQRHLQYECLCKVHATPLNRPLFECSLSLKGF